MESRGASALLLRSMATSDSSPPGDDCDYCPNFQHALELVGRRWTGSILKVIGDRSLRFRDVRAEVPGLSDRLLDTRLTELEREGLISRTEDGGAVFYSATTKGIGLRPTFTALAPWAYPFPEPDRAGALPGRQLN